MSISCTRASGLCRAEIGEAADLLQVHVQVAPGVDIALVMALLICLDDASGELEQIAGVVGELVGALAGA